MKISFVVPVFNSVTWLPQTIESLLSQKHKDKEIIVVNDKSNDYIEFLKEHYKYRVEWIDREERSGAASCRNYANSLASGDIIAVCDAGDIYTPNRGTLIEKYFTENEDKDILYSHVKVVGSDGGDYGVQEATEWDGTGKPPISHPTVAYRKKVADKVQYCMDSVDTDFYEFFMHDAFKAGYKFGVLDNITCIKYDISDSENSRDISKAKELKAKKYEEYGIKVEAA